MTSIFFILLGILASEARSSAPLIPNLPSVPVAPVIVKRPHIEVELISQVKSIRPGSQAVVGLRMKADPGWHTYWKNPGDSGLATTLKWELPPGFSAGPILWPAPERHDVGPLTNFGYEGTTVLPVIIQWKSGSPLSGAWSVLRARASWLVCESICIPGSADLAIALQNSPNEPVMDPDWGSQIEQSLNQLPRAVASPEKFVQIQADESRVRIQFTDPKMQESHRTGEWFPADPQWIAHSKRPIRGPKGEWIFERSELNQKGDRRPLPTQKVEWVWAAQGAESAESWTVDLQKVALIEDPSWSWSRLLWILLAAIGGGLILNLMPCVFPVLSIKVLAILHQSRTEVSRVRQESLIFCAGVFASFWVLSGTLSLLRAAGVAVGWGFHLQSPWFVGALAIVFFLLGLQLLGVFEWGSRWMGLGQHLTQSRSLWSSFWSGVLATVVSTPCSAPLLGAALGFAVTQSPKLSLVIFSAIALGFCLPYLAIALFPSSLRVLPKPGVWMLKLKKGMAFPMFASTAWLVWVLMQLQAAPVSSTIDENSLWQKFDATRVEQIVQQKQGRPVFVDFTAAWCVTCQVNHRLVLSQPQVLAALQESGIDLMKADWTQRDPEISRTLDALGRSGVPVYALYLPGKPKPYLFSELLTVDLFLKQLQEALNEN